MSLCMICRKREATVFLNIYENKKMIKEARICSKCMEQFGFSTDPKTSMEKLLNKLKSLSTSELDEESIEIYRCRRCGLSQSEFDEDMELGCPMCYKYFSSALDPVIQNIHDSLRHLGKKAAGVHARKERLLLMNRKLQDALKAEDFETAAMLRDEISKLEKESNA